MINESAVANFGPDEAPTLPERAPLSSSSRLVLVVDDEPDARDMYEETLRSLGYRVIVAVDGVDAVTRAVAERPDAILMDVAMPAMDGIEATRRIKADALDAPCLVILMTAFGTESFAAGKEAGCDAYLSKPFNPHVVDVVLRAHWADAAPPVPSVVKACPCGRTYTRMEWRRLPLVGHMFVGGGRDAELRNCSCGSTLAIPKQA